MWRSARTFLALLLVLLAGAGALALPLHHHADGGDAAHADRDCPACHLLRTSAPAASPAPRTVPLVTVERPAPAATSADHGDPARLLPPPRSPPAS